MDCLNFTKKNGYYIFKNRQVIMLINREREGEMTVEVNNPWKLQIKFKTQKFYNPRHKYMKGKKVK